MCGIIAYIANNNKTGHIGKPILEQYQEQLNRGEKGFGLMEIFKDRVEVQRSVEPVKALMDVRFSEAQIGVFHHRYPTSTENTISQTHPFFISHDELEFDYWINHNGVIHNAEDLFKHHTEELGYIYDTYEPEETTFNYSQGRKSSIGSKYSKKEFNDSESLAIEVARYFNGDTEEIAAEGTIVFFAVQLDKDTGKPLHMLWGRNEGNPLDCINQEDGLLLASTIYDDTAEIITPMTFEVFDLQKYFKSRKKVYDVQEEISGHELKFFKKPEPVKTNIATHGTGFVSHVNFPERKKATTTTTSSKEEEAQEEVYEGDFPTKREKAFAKMSERVMLDIQVSVETFFDNLAYSDVDDEETEMVANDLNDLLISKVESCREKVRPYFDKEEEKELDKEMIEDGIDGGYMKEYANSAPIEDEEYEEELSANEQANLSQERFNEIIR